MVEKDAEIWTLSFFRSEKVRKFELCNFLCWKKCGKLDFIIFIDKKRSESWTLSFLLAEKARNVELLSFLMAEKDAESWTLSFLMAEKFGK